MPMINAGQIGDHRIHDRAAAFAYAENEAGFRRRPGCRGLEADATPIGQVNAQIQMPHPSFPCRCIGSNPDLTGIPQRDSHCTGAGLSLPREWKARARECRNVT
jgi:hypothetical protein